MRPRPSGRWKRLLIRKFAQADVAAPDGRRYVVRVVPMMLRRDAPVLDGTTNVVMPPDTVSGIAVLWSVFTSRAAWGVRVLREPGRFGFRPLMYGEEYRDFDASVARALEIANGLAHGRAPRR